MREAGFRETRVENLASPDSMVIGIVFTLGQLIGNPQPRWGLRLFGSEWDLSEVSEVVRLRLRI
jgi:hypothetical protein